LSNSTGPSPAGAEGSANAPARPWWLGIGIIAIGGVWLYGAASLAQTARYAVIGPGLFVTLIGGTLVLLGLLLILQIAQGERFDAQDAEDALANAPADRVAFYTAVAAAAVPLLTMRHLGFPITATLSFALVARAFGSRRVALDLAIGAALAIVAYFGFTRLGVTLGAFLPFLGR
jgi:putative tricarboxylic transport membrane protein